VQRFPKQARRSRTCCTNSAARGFQRRRRGSNSRCCAEPAQPNQCYTQGAFARSLQRQRAANSQWRSTIALDKRSAKSFIRINDRIRAREIRVIDEKGEQLGILPPFEALKIARERGLDLVEVSPNAVPPVCRIQDYGRFLYEKEKSERAARKKQKVITIKEVKFSVTVDEHDYQTKKNQAVRFLNEGDKVKASLRFRGRQMAHRDLGYKIINRLIQDVNEVGVVEFMPRMEGTTLHAILAPSKKAEGAKPKPVAPKPVAAQAAIPPSSAEAQASAGPVAATSGQS
jgi:translation initiation factor IF-3